MDRGLFAIGVVALVMGLVSVFYGNKEAPVKGGLILRILSTQRPLAKWITVMMGAALIVAGAAIILKAMKLT